jgi:hypothetical protein
MKYLLLLLFPVWGFAQTPSIEWQKSLGGSGKDYANSICQTVDGGYIVAGYTNSTDGDVVGNHGGDDIWVVKLSSTGIVEWTKALGGTGNEVATYVIQSADGGYVIAGSSTSNDGDISGNHGHEDAWVAKLDNTGNLQWQKSFGGNNTDAATAIQQLADGGYIVGCYAISENNGDVAIGHGAAEYWIVKLSSIGNIEWNLCLGGQSYEFAHDIHQTADGGFIVGGNTFSIDGNVTGNNGNMDYWVVKLDTIQQLEWQKALGGTGTDVLASVVQTNDGGYITAGHVYSQDGDVAGSGFHGPFMNDFWVVKLNSTGAIQWKIALGGSGNDFAQSIQQTADGGYIVFGFTFSNDGNVSGNHGYFDYWMVKLDSQGNIEWQKTFGGTDQDGYNFITQQVDGAHSIQQTSDLGYVFAGYAKSSDGDATLNHGDFDYWVVKVGFSTGLNQALFDNINVYPNPSSNKVFVNAGSNINIKRLSLCNTIGQTLITTNENSIDVSKFTQGLYLIKIETDRGNVVKKILVK